MRSLLRFLIRNYAFLLFLFLEVVSLVLVFSYNSFQRSHFLNASNFISASLYNTTSSVLQYFELARVNSQLAEENAQLRTQLENQNYSFDTFAYSLIAGGIADDSAFLFTPARIINNSINKQQNYITLDRGRKHGLKEDQGIIASGGIVGVITSVSESYATGLSLLNPRWSVSAKVKKNGYYGSLAWDGKNYREADLLEIPFHVNLEKGDTIVTSGYSSIFPEGLLVGTISQFEQTPGENYYNIKVKLAVDFKSIRHVQVVENLKKQELKELEKTARDGQGNN